MPRSNLYSLHTIGSNLVGGPRRRCLLVGGGRKREDDGVDDCGEREGEWWPHIVLFMYVFAFSIFFSRTNLNANMDCTGREHGRYRLHVHMQITILETWLSYHCFVDYIGQHEDPTFDPNPITFCFCYVHHDTCMPRRDFAWFTWTLVIWMCDFFSCLFAKVNAFRGQLLAVSCEIKTAHGL